MRIGLISDTHGYLDPRILEHFGECDEVWHAGDWGGIEIADHLSSFKPLRGVYGNIDDQKVRKQFSRDLLFEICGLRIFMTHIGGYPNRYDKRVREILETEAPDIFICGHSHILKVVRDKRLNNLLVLNPGAAGHQGLHKIRTVLRFSARDSKLSDLEVIELGKRGALKS